MALLNRLLGACALLAILGSAAAQDIITVPAPDSGNNGGSGEITLSPPGYPISPGPSINPIDLTPPDITGVNPRTGWNDNDTGFVPPPELFTPPGINTDIPPAPQVDPLDIDTGSLPVDMTPGNTDTTPANTDDTTATDRTPGMTPPAPDPHAGTPADTGGHPQWPTPTGRAHVPGNQHQEIPTPGHIRRGADNTTNRMLNTRPGNRNVRVFTTTRGFDQERHAVTNSINNIRKITKDEDVLTIGDTFDPLLHWKYPTRRPCDMWSSVETGAMLKAWLDRFGGQGYDGREPVWTYVNDRNIKDGMRVRLNRLTLYIECANNTFQVVKAEGKTTTVIFADLRKPGQRPEVKIGEIPHGVNLGPVITNELRTRDEFDKARNERREKARADAEDDAEVIVDPWTDEIVNEPVVDAAGQDGDEPTTDPSDEPNVIDEIMADGARRLELEEKRKELEEKLRIELNQPGDGYKATQAMLDDVSAQLDGLEDETGEVTGSNDEPVEEAPVARDPRDVKLEQVLAAIRAEQAAADAKIAARNRWEKMQAEREAELEALDKRFNALQLELYQAIRDGDKSRQRAIEREYDDLHDSTLHIYAPLTWEQVQMEAGEDARTRARSEQHMDEAFRAFRVQAYEIMRTEKARARQSENRLLMPAYFMAGVGKACWASAAETFLMAGDYINWLRNVDHDMPNSGLFKLAAEHDGAFEISYAIAAGVAQTVPAVFDAAKSGDCVALGESVTNLAFLAAGGYSIFKTAPRIQRAAHRMGIRINTRMADFIETFGRWREAKANGTITPALDDAFRAELTSLLNENVETMRLAHTPDKTEVMHPGGNPRRLSEDPEAARNPLDDDYVIDLTTEEGRLQLDELSKKHMDYILAERERLRKKDEGTRKARKQGWGDWGEDVAPPRH